MCTAVLLTTAPNLKPPTPASSRIGKQTPVCLRSGMLPRNNKTQTTATHTTGMELKGMRLNERSQTQKSTYRMLPFIRHSRTGNTAVRPLPWEGTILTRKEHGELSRAMEMFYILIWVGVSWMDTHVKIHGASAYGLCILITVCKVVSKAATVFKV